jgi:putative ABC transport system permease protein
VRTLIIRVINKIKNNKGMMFCLLLGIVLAIAIISSIPVYTNGILQRMLIKDMEKYQLDNNEYPGKYLYDRDFLTQEKEKNMKMFDTYSKTFNESVSKSTGIPLISSNITVIDQDAKTVGLTVKGDRQTEFGINIEAITELENHINISSGRMPSDKKVDGIYEVMITPEMFTMKAIVVDKIYEVRSRVYDFKTDEGKPILFKVVGVFSPKDLKDSYWHDSIWKHRGFFMNYNLFINEYLKEDKTKISNAQWYAQLDYTKIKIRNTKDILRATEGIYKSSKDGVSATSVPIYGILKSYEVRSKSLGMTLWVLQLPILLMIIFYVFMISQLITKKDKSEIAVLKSRGASTMQIVSGYFLQGIILSLLALAIGPILGILMCRVLGASNGFLEFVNRSSLDIGLKKESYFNSLYAVAMFIITMLIPVIFACRDTIVKQKQQKARSSSKPIWKRLYFDIILLFGCIYGIRNYRSLANIFKVTGAGTGEIKIDPMLFFLSTLFILALSMLFLRVFKYLMRLIYLTRRKGWSAHAYTSLVSVERNADSNQFVIIFLVLTIAQGIFSANCARTLNSSMMEQITYRNGSDIAVSVTWKMGTQKWTESQRFKYEYDKAHLRPDVFEKNMVNGMYFTDVYVEPSIDKFSSIKGVELTTKVLTRKGAQCGAIDNAYVMGIIPHEFGEVSQLRKGLIPHYFNEYLNIMTKEPRAVIVSTSMKKKYNAKVGDTIWFGWKGAKQISGTIFAFVDYWPTYNPYDKGESEEAPDLIVANLKNIFDATPIEPYEVWIKQADNVETASISNAIKDTGLNVEKFVSSRQEIIEKRSDAMLQGMNGALTMNFIATIIITCIGFLIYWILSIKERTLQFGIFRAMGMTSREISKLIFIEQLLISLSSAVYGIFAGILTSKLFVPMLQLIYDVQDTVLPFNVTSYSGDYIKLFICVSAIFVVGFVVMKKLSDMIKVGQALRLGDD